MRLSAALALAAAVQTVAAATAEDWKTRSIYQLITDRFAPPSATAPARTDPLPQDCDPALQTWCGGTWLSIIDKLDYIQSMGFDAIWISPVHHNIDVKTAYNYAYHGYWVDDLSQLNPRFGEEQDLHTLVSAVHQRGMYIMVDIVVNNIAANNVSTATSTEALTAAGIFWKDPQYFHPYCPIDYNNQTSVEYCWLGDENLPLMDVNTENTYVQTTVQSWIANFVSEFNIDGLRIDAAKHVPGEFWPAFGKAAGVFCIGEVYGDDYGFASQFQTQGWMDAVLGFPLQAGLSSAFSQQNPTQNMSAFIDMASHTISLFPNPEYLGNFLENHDLPRFANITADPRMILNAMIPQFLFDGIPIVYYGQEQDIKIGNADPYNRGALWPTGYQNTSTLQTITRLNTIRKKMIDLNLGSYMDSRSQIIAYTDHDVAIQKGPIIMVLTNRGSPEQAASFGITNTGWQRNQAVVDLLTCSERATGAGGSLSVSYSEQGYGGLPYVFMLVDDARKLNMCTYEQLGIVASNQTSNAAYSSAAVSTSPAVGLSFLSAAAAFLSFWL